MNTEGITKIARMVAADCDSDAESLDGKPFNGHSVAVQFGNTLAMVKAIAELTVELADHNEKLQRRIAELESRNAVYGRAGQ